MATQDRVLQDLLFFNQLNRQQVEYQRQDEQYAFAKEAQQLQLQNMREASLVDSEPYSLGPSRTAAELPEEVVARRELARAQAYLGETAQGGGTNATYAQDAQQDLADIEPLVRGGVLGANDVRAVVKSAAMGGITDQRNTRKADRVMQAIMRNTENGTFNEGQTAGAIASAEKEFGPEVLLQSSSYTKMKGLTQQMQVARELQKFEAAEQYGVEPEVLTYDRDTGELTLDKNAAQIKQYKMVTEEHQAEQVSKVSEARRKAIEVQVNAVGAQIRSTNTLLAATKDASYINVLNKLTVEQHKLLRELAGTGTEGVAAPSQPTAATSKQYKSKDEFLNALKTGQHQVGEPGLVAGVKVKAFPNGDIKRVQ